MGMGENAEAMPLGEGEEIVRNSSDGQIEEAENDTKSTSRETCRGRADVVWCKWWNVLYQLL
jgi:hypothetical protein